MNFLKSFFNKKDKIDNLDKYRGEYGIVLETIDNKNDVGYIFTNGKKIIARSENDEVLAKDTKVVITNIIDEIAYVVEFNI